jgi:hypothetical protein
MLLLVASAIAAPGTWVITGLESHAHHTHGGAPAQLGHARFRVQYDGEVPVVMTVRRIEYVTGRDCDAPPAEVSATPAFGGLFPEDGSRTESVRALPVSPGTLEVTVGFEWVEAYYVHCDRFAFRVTFDVGGLPLVATAETQVIREEPLR